MSSSIWGAGVIRHLFDSSETDRRRVTRRFHLSMAEVSPQDPPHTKARDSSLLHVLGYDLLQHDYGSCRRRAINLGNLGGLFRLEHFGVAGITDLFVDWLERFATSTTPPGVELFARGESMRRAPSRTLGRRFD